MWLFPSFLNHLFLLHYLFLSVFPPKMKSVSLAPMCLQVCHTFFFSCKILQESCLDKCPSVSLFQVHLECTSGPRAQKGSWMSHGCGAKAMAEWEGTYISTTPTLWSTRDHLKLWPHDVLSGRHTTCHLWEEIFSVLVGFSANSCFVLIPPPHLFLLVGG